MPKRRVHYGSINAQESREIFIRMALVAGEYVTNAKFFEHNNALIKEIEALEHKTRRQDILVDEQEIFAFYDAIIPENIFNGAGFEKWRKQAEQENLQLLYLKREYLMRHQADHATEIQFPEIMQTADGSALSLTYRFEPGHILDGVTVSVPLPLLNRLDAKQFDVLVPGLIREKVTWCLKALPKQIRRVLVPLPESVTQFLQTESATGQVVSLHDALAKFILRKTSISIPADTWADKETPTHLLMNIKVIDDEGHELASSRNLEALQMELGRAAQLTFANTDCVEEKLDIERYNIKSWNFGDLPDEITFTRNRQKLTGYPALVDQQESVSIRLFDTAEAAQIAMREGLRRLLCFELKDRMKQLDKNLPGLKQAALQLASLMNPGDLKQDMLHAITVRAFISEASLPRNEAAFSAYKQQSRIRLSTAIERSFHFNTSHWQ